VKIGRMTWVGFGVALIGWVLLVAALTISDTLLKAGSLVAVLSMRGDVVTLAQSLIVSGFGLAVVGTLRAGFGAFTRFFDAVLQRSAAPRPRGPTPLEPEPLTPEPVVDRIDDLDDADTVVPVTPVPDRPATERRSPPPRPTPIKPAAERPGPARGKERNYIVLADGSVEVETMFGTRVFASLDEAKDFIR
jgi:hypothetical protein